METNGHSRNGALIVLAAGLILAALSAPAWSDETPVRGVESVLVERINAVRAENGLDPLDYAGDDVRDVARSHSERMMTVGFFAHRDDRGRTAGDRLTESGVDWQAVGENLLEEVGPATVDGVVTDAVSAWVDSPDHRANILSARYTRTAVGMVSREGRTYLTQIFLVH